MLMSTKKSSRSDSKHSRKRPSFLLYSHYHYHLTYRRFLIHINRSGFPTVTLMGGMLKNLHGN
ncbi:hypothetical protein BIW11_04731 [Tropilaelaps mercedesae]|uniref:Uncharacterized protein n=1 Tax=Tropilaelaps mercedesae TaxID=418985 RepID=A0A1V9X200_9ACAR|nr:hypothetical protein BIW11_04731 [Tropilaelaps mercedesae]